VQTLKICPTFLQRLRRRIFGLSPEEATFARRGFHASDAGARQYLEHIGYTFLEGYHAALEDAQPDTLALTLNTVEPELRGFAFEGAAMALTLLDQLTPWHSRRFRAFVEGPGTAHVYMVHVGAGWALARLPWRLDRALHQLDPLLRWLAIDGFGFHEGYFHWPRYIAQQALPQRLTGYARRVFDQGLGRSLWFVEGADVNRISATVATFHPARQADLWSGVGLACSYAGGVDRSAIEALRTAAEPYQPQLTQGVAFAAKARQRAGNPAPHTTLACEILCGLSADAAAAVTDAALQDLPSDGPEPAYEVWRRRIQAQLTKEVVTQ
jgi:hypothetical protein